MLRFAATRGDFGGESLDRIVRRTTRVDFLGIFFIDTILQEKKQSENTNQALTMEESNENQLRWF